MSSRRIQDLHAELYNIYEVVSNEWEKRYPNTPKPFLTATYRDEQEQQMLFDMPHNHLDDDKDGLIDESDEWRTNAQPGKSPHNFKPALAFDIAFRYSGGKLDWKLKWFKLFNDIVLEKFGGFVVRWGGHFKKKDNPHFELSNWKTLARDYKK